MEPSHIAPSDGYYGDGAKTSVSCAHAQGEEVGSRPAYGYNTVSATVNVQYQAEVEVGNYQPAYAAHAYGGSAPGNGGGAATSAELANTQPLCECGLGSARLMSRSEKNPNRWFYKCSKFKDDATQCRFFQWEDESPKSPQGPPTGRRRTEDPSAPYTSRADGSYRPTYGGYKGVNPSQPPASGDNYQTGNQGTAAPAGRDRSQDQCFACGQFGHWTSECPTNNKGGGGGGGNATGAAGGCAGGGVYGSQQCGGGGGEGGASRGACFKCGSTDHWSRDCTAGAGGGGYGGQVGGAGGSGGGGGTRGACFKCGSTDHWSRDCTAAGAGGGGYGGQVGGAGGSGGGGGTRGACFKCGSTDHWSRDCTAAGGGGGGYGGGGAKRKYEGGSGYGGVGYGGVGGYGGGGGGGRGGGAAGSACFHCNGVGHWSKDCPSKGV